MTYFHLSFDSQPLLDLFHSFGRFMSGQTTDTDLLKAGATVASVINHKVAEYVCRLHNDPIITQQQNYEHKSLSRWSSPLVTILHRQCQRLVEGNHSWSAEFMKFKFSSSNICDSSLGVCFWILPKKFWTPRYYQGCTKFQIDWGKPIGIENNFLLPKCVSRRLKIAPKTVEIWFWVRSDVGEYESKSGVKQEALYEVCCFDPKYMPAKPPNMSTKCQVINIDQMASIEVMYVIMIMFVRNLSLLLLDHPPT